jgi:large subunit ribosomal protein L18
LIEATMNQQKRIIKSRQRRGQRVRNKIVGNSERPRLAVFRSSKHIYVQLIDDIRGVTLAATGTTAKDVRQKVPYGGNKKAAEAVGTRLAEIAKEKGIAKVAFDRGHYRYHGRIKALADAARKAGLDF